MSKPRCQIGEAAGFPWDAERRLAIASQLRDIDRSLSEQFLALTAMNNALAFRSFPARAAQPVVVRVVVSVVMHAPPRIG